MKKLLIHFVLFLILILTTINFGWSPTNAAIAGGFIDFENGIDGQPIQSTIPGLQFTTTAGYDWVYADWRTGYYNGPYPNGPYYSNGSFFAWLGPNQGAGRIDFTQGCATYLQVWVSSLAGLTADGYRSDGALIASASVEGNLETGQMERLRVDSPENSCFAYVILHDTGNYWLIDDLTTDASGVPTTRPPVIILPGLTGSRLDNHDACKNLQEEIWPAENTLAFSQQDEHLFHLKLDSNGEDPFSECDDIFVNRDSLEKSENGVIGKAEVDILGFQKKIDFYGPLIDYLRGYGFDVFPYGYDWRLDLQDIADELDTYVEKVLTETSSTQVNIVDHSLGGLLARYYVTSKPERAAKVEQIISLGTPFLGAPKSLKTLRWGDRLGKDFGLIQVGPANDNTVRDISQNAPSFYEILPTQGYFDVYGQGYYRVEGAMRNFGQTRTVILSDHNSGLALEAEDFHSSAMDDWSSAPLSVAYRLIVGSGKLDTPGVIHEYSLIDLFGKKYITKDIEGTNGDGTVPIHSADLKGNGYDFSAQVPIWYTKDLDHVGLIIEPYVREFIASILATPPSNASLNYANNSTLPTAYPPDMALYKGSADRFVKHLATADVPPAPPEMSETPFPLDGSQITAFGAGELHIYDQNGSHIGVGENGQLEVGISNGTYESYGNQIFVTVPSGNIYTIEAISSEYDYFDLRIRDLQGLVDDVIRRTISFSNVPIGTEGIADLSYSPNSNEPTPTLYLDTDGDGDFDQTLSATGDIGPEQSSDHTPPNIDISVVGEQAPQGWYVGDVEVSINVTDDSSGVGSVIYTTDLGKSVYTYESAFIVDAIQVPLLVVHASDQAGNRGSKMIQIGPRQIFLPYISSE